FRQGATDRDLDDEIRLHLELETEKHIRAGMPPARARRKALLDFGGVERTKEAHRDGWGVRWIQEIVSDARFALRTLRKSPAFAIAAILTLTLGIASAVAIFGFVDSALIRPLPYPDLPRLMGVFKTSPIGGQRLGLSYPDYLDLERSNRVFASSAAYHKDEGFVLSDRGAPSLVNGTGVTSEFFRLLGVAPVIGRDFAAAPATDDLLTDPAEVILSYGAWQHWFHGRSDAVGSAVTLNGGTYTVIGVLPASFRFDPAGAADFWTTLRPYAGTGCFASRGCQAMGVIARLKEDVTQAEALAAVQAIAAQEAREHPDPDLRRGETLAPLSTWIVGDVEPILIALMAGASLLLLIAYVGVAGLLLVRAHSRQHELAIRTALGAGRRRLVQPFIIEGTIVVAIAAVLALIAATAARRLLLASVPADMLESMSYLRGGWGWHAPAFALGVGLVAVLLFAVIPAARIPLARLRGTLAISGPVAAGISWRRFGARLIILELATTLVLLAGAGLLGKSLYALLHVDMGFTPSRLATLTMQAPEGKYARREQALALHQAILDRLRRLPGVTAVATARSLPVVGVPSTQIGFVGVPDLGASNEVGHQVVSPGYLTTLKADLVKGRFFNRHDDFDAIRVVVINQTLARRYFAHADPIGRQVFFHPHGSAPQISGSQHPLLIVGVIADVKDDALDAKAEPVLYSAYAQSPGQSFRIVVRTAGDAGAALPSIVAAVRDVDRDILISDAATMPDIIQHSQAAYLHRVLAWLTGVFAILALMLTAIGLYGVVAYSVSRRTHEIGVRMALGAHRGAVYGLILGEAGRLTLIGTVIGLAGAIGAGLSMRKLLFGVQSWDVSILGGVAVIVVVCALLASYLPARRASRVDPMIALRTE
ncbi:MAG TPA: ABC transporter permease, partial [Vicinamibacterales bacterium]